MKKVLVVFIIAGLVSIAAYLFARYKLNTPGFKPAQAADTSFRADKKETILDLRPKLIVRLQNLVHEGSNGLFKLSIKEIDPDILASVVVLKNVLLEPNSQTLANLSAREKENCNLFSFKTDSIRITGIGIQDLASADVIDLKKVYINAPVIRILQTSNGSTPEKRDLYECLLGQLKRLSAEEIVINNATVVNTSQNNTSASFEDVDVKLTDLRVDSNSQNDKDRFLFSKQVLLSLNNYTRRSKDGFYDFKVDHISIVATEKKLTAKGIKLHPRFGKAVFGKKAGLAKERYELSFSSVSLKNLDWWSFANEESLIADEATIAGGNFQVYLDRSLPRGKSKMGNYPHQLLMKLPSKINIRQLKVQNLAITYEEFNPLSGKVGKVKISGVNGRVNNLTNIPSVIQKLPRTTIAASGRFMNVAPVNLSLRLDLANHQKGSFAAKLHIKNVERDVVNSIAEPIGLFRIKEGKLNELRSEVVGHNNGASGKVLFLYDDLKIAALEKDAGANGGLDKKDVTTFVANSFLLKDDNPASNEKLRNPDCDFTRDPYSSFFNLIWKTTFVGILKTTGLPEKLASKK